MKKTLLAVALLGASSAVMADSWIYGGISVGQSDFASDDQTAYSVHVGTGILPIIGMEAGVTQHGEFNVAGHDTEVRSYYAAIKPSINFGPLQVYAKGGFHQWDKKVQNGSDDDDLDMMWGVGADYEVFGPLSLGANYMNYVVGSDDIGSFNLTATLHFL
ncbi:TPA: outer membrane beta-barrel protein [Vibrio alginolyticus]